MSRTPTRQTRSGSTHVFLEELESRICPTAVCDANPTYTAECNYLNNLIPQSAITVTAVQSGNWSNPATWGGKLPGNGDNVWIPNGITVTVDTQEPGQLRSILDNGVLTFAPNVNTSLTVNTVVVGTDNNPTGQPEGELDIGTAANPIQSGVTAKLTFADLGPQSSLFPNDPKQLSGGLISMGTLNIYGSQVTPWVNMNNAAAGATTLTLASQPVGWKAGDTLLIPGTSPTANQDEQIQIASIQKNADGTATVTLATPLQYAHTAPTGQATQVADENRSVIIQSQDTTNQDGAAGQVMEMHNDAVSVQYAALLNLGRTNKAVPLNNVQLDANGNVVPGTGTNQTGRYALHFHRDYYPGLNGQDPPIQVVGNFETGSPGWGYVNHSSNVDFIDNVAYNNFGSAFVDEAGNEIGSFQNNLAVDTRGVGGNVATRATIQDFGQGGDGFWLQSPGTSILNNVVDEANIGYALYGDGLVQEGLGTTQFWTSTTDPTQLTSVNSQPIATFAGNSAANVGTALNTYHRNPWVKTPDTVTGFVAWGVTGYGVRNQSINVTLQNSVLLAAPNNTSTGVSSVQGYASGLNLTNMDVEGFATGVLEPVGFGANTVTGGYWDNQTNFLIWSIAAITPQLTFSGPIVFGPHSQLDYNLQNPDLRGNPNLIFQSHQILLPDGSELYYAAQAANFVPFPTATGGIPAALVGLTNAQLYKQFGLAVGGVPAPDNAVTDPSTNGLIGAPITPRLVADTVSVPAGQVGMPYYVRYDLHPFTQFSQPPIYTDPTPTVLQPGWNVITRTINGQTYSFLVHGNIFNTYSLGYGTVAAAYNQSITAPPGYTVSFTVKSGTVPPGLSLTTQGNALSITGTPTAVGQATIQVTATDPTGVTTTQNYSLIVNPESVTQQMSWSSSALTLDPSTQLFNGTVTLTNNGPTALTGTIWGLVWGLPNGATLTNANGTYNGYSYVQIILPGGKLSPGQSVTFPVQFNTAVKSFKVGTYEASL